MAMEPNTPVMNAASQAPQNPHCEHTKRNPTRNSICVIRDLIQLFLDKINEIKRSCYAVVVLTIVFSCIGMIYTIGYEGMFWYELHALTSSG